MFKRVPRINTPRATKYLGSTPPSLLVLTGSISLFFFLLFILFFARRTNTDDNDDDDDDDDGVSLIVFRGNILGLNDLINVKQIRNDRMIKTAAVDEFINYYYLYWIEIDIKL